jgi:hypothetical protein
VSDITTLIGCVVSIVGAALLILKIAGTMIEQAVEVQREAQSAENKRLQKEIDGLQSEARYNKNEIVTLRGLVDKWQERYYNVKTECDALKYELQAMKAARNNG